jgi:hypothetical protein
MVSGGANRGRLSECLRIYRKLWKVLRFSHLSWRIPPPSLGSETHRETAKSAVFSDRHAVVWIMCDGESQPRFGAVTSKGCCSRRSGDVEVCPKSGRLCSNSVPRGHLHFLAGFRGVDQFSPLAL